MLVINQEALKNFSKALEGDDFEEIKRWFPQVNSAATSDSPNAWFPFDLLYSCGSIEILSFLVEHGVNLNCPILEMAYQTLIYGLIRSLETKALTFAIEKGADVNVTDGNGDTPLSFAVRNEARLKFVPLLLEKGANPRLGNNIFSILNEDPQRLSAFYKHVKTSFNNLLRKQNLEQLQKQIKQFRSLDDVPEDFLEDLDTFECLAGLDDSDIEEEGSMSEERDEIFNSEDKYNSLENLEVKRQLKLSEELTNDTDPSNPSFNRVHSHSSEEEGLPLDKLEVKNYKHNQNFKPQPVYGKEREERQAVVSGF